MSNENQTEANFPDFYERYAKRSLWFDHESVVLSLNIDPWEIMDGDGKLIAKQVKIYKEEFCADYYYDHLDLINEAVKCNIIDGKVSPLIWPDGEKSKRLFTHVVPLSFINWCKVKHISFPEELEKLVKKYNPNYIDWEARCEKLESKIEELETKNIKLTEEINSVPNIKRLNSWQKGFIGMVAMKYGYERLLANFGNIYNKTEIDDKLKLSYAKIRNDFDLQGIGLDDDVIKGLIQESIKYLPYM